MTTFPSGSIVIPGSTGVPDELGGLPRGLVSRFRSTVTQRASEESDSAADGIVGCRSIHSSAMEPRLLFESNLPTIERVIASVCRRARLRGADAEDFASAAKIALLEDDCAILRSYAGRSSLDAYLAVVIQRMLSDERMRTLGRWQSSTEAMRLGAEGVLLETLLRRDQRPMEETWPIVHAAYPELSRADVERMAARLPERAPRPRFVELEGMEAPSLAASETADSSLRAAEERRLSERTMHVVRNALDSFSLEDQMLVRFHYGSGMSIADISRMMRLPQRPLYRRLEKSLATLRQALLEAGIDATSILDLISSVIAEELDFGLSKGLRETAAPSDVSFERQAAAKEVP